MCETLGTNWEDTAKQQISLKLEAWEAIARVSALAEKYANEAEKDNPQGYGGKRKTLDNSISYWLVSREIWEALNGANGSSDDVQKVVE